MSPNPRAREGSARSPRGELGRGAATRCRTALTSTSEVVHYRTSVRQSAGRRVGVGACPGGPKRAGGRGQMTVKEMVELEDVQALLTRGQEQGFLSIDEVAQSVEGVSLDEGAAEELYRHLDELGIELLEDAEARDRAGADRRGRRPSPAQAQPQGRHEHRRAAALPQGRGPGPAAHGQAGGRAGQADRARRPRRPRRRWSSPTCGSSSRSRRTTATRAWRSST